MHMADALLSPAVGTTFWAGQGDMVLMAATAEKAARNEFNRRVRTESMTRGAVEGFAAAMRTGWVRGASPTVELERGPTQQAELAPKRKDK